MLIWHLWDPIQWYLKWISLNQYDLIQKDFIEVKVWYCRHIVQWDNETENLSRWRICGCTGTDNKMTPNEDKAVNHRPAHDDVIKWKHFPRYWPFVRGIHRSLVNSLHKGQWRGALMFSLIRVWINGWVNNREAGDLRRYRAHYDVIVMLSQHLKTTNTGQNARNCAE